MKMVGKKNILMQTDGLKSRTSLQEQMANYEVWKEKEEESLQENRDSSDRIMLHQTSHNILS